MAKNYDKKGGAAAPPATGGGVQMTAADPSEIQRRIDEQAELKRELDLDAHREFIGKLRREQEEAERLRPLPPITQATSARQARPDDEMILMVFPRPMFIWAEPVPGHENPIYQRRMKVAFGSGLQEVPESLSQDWYLKSAGVKTARPEPEPNEKDD